MISPLAYIHPEAKIGEGCEIGPFCFIDKNVELGPGNHLMNSVTILSGARIGEGNTFHPGCVISGVPQDLKFRGEETTCVIGSHNTIRENVTISRGTASKGTTQIGDHNLLMENMHIGHDTFVGSHCILGNSTKVAGEVVIHDFAILSACVLVHQFCRIGSYVMVGGGAGVNQDVPPYCTAAHNPIGFFGLNLVGLKRRGFTSEQIDTIHRTYNIIYAREGNFKSRLERLLTELPASPEVKYIYEFASASQRGLITKP